MDRLDCCKERNSLSSQITSGYLRMNQGFKSSYGPAGILTQSLLLERRRNPWFLLLQSKRSSFSQIPNIFECSLGCSESKAFWHAKEPWSFEHYKDLSFKKGICVDLPARDLEILVESLNKLFRMLILWT